MKLNIKNTEISVDSNATVEELKKVVGKNFKKNIHRISLKFTNESSVDVRLEDSKKTLEQYGLKDGMTVIYKDLGPQIGYRTVFLLEYFGPMLFVGLWALRPSFLFGANAALEPFNWVAKLGIICWMIHFAKREFETLSVISPSVSLPISYN